MSKPTPRRAALSLAPALALAALAAPALAQSWPSQPIRLVVPFAPGGTTDLIARLVATPLGESLGQPVVVENRPGAGATLGSLQVAQSPPDGHVLVLSSIASHAIAPALYSNVRYDALTDFTHVALLSLNPSVIVAHPRLGPADMADLARRHREDGRGLDMASSGAGSSNHLLIVRLGQILGKELNHIPFRGAGPAMTAVIGGQVPLMSDSLPSAAAHIRQGSVRALATSGEARHPAFPEVPTLREAGFDLVTSSWFGLSAPARLPASVTDRLSREVLAVLARPEVQSRFAEFGGTPGTLDPAGFTQFVASELARWEPVVRESGAKPD
ncbi:Bug family tripartite tricarboxylate transporter substrate binding protein [Sabulicella glaciei]|uniref:Tripartite tricarboxylate transporter substrate binding protein n=1 Tax=Sabulicella glaciei TaxID=2984948 RepID=A0ABT3P0G6_9PROT|nr:tripartite tricarboxylate transporter substrate binding protein [Roseococcus sp. MDT2-1-1]MCW8087896.1 tripartite tricarboxylate transporter substrate binding protein [Roseococcus sp. MDT2-1-1]